MAKKHPFECVAVVLQGGGALGSYQAGVYEALAEHDLHPDWVAGVSIGSINAALIAGNPPEKRVEALHSFWDTVTQPSVVPPALLGLFFHGAPEAFYNTTHQWLNQICALNVLMQGAPGFFSPRLPSALMPTGSQSQLSFYDTQPLRETLENLVDFDRINDGKMRLSVGSVNARTGNFEYFDSTTQKIDARHIMASGALPPGLPAVEIDGEYYWDGGIVSNTPLQWVLEGDTRQHSLIFQVDLWSASGEIPKDLVAQDMRLKDIRYSSRTRLGTDQFRKTQKLRRALAHLLEQLPESNKYKKDTQIQELIEQADDKVYNIAHLIYRSKSYEGDSKDFEFSRHTMLEHWAAGYADAQSTLANPNLLKRPTNPEGVEIFDMNLHGHWSTPQ